MQGTCVQIAFLKLAYELVGFHKGLSHILGLAPPSSVHDQKFLKFLNFFYVWCIFKICFAL